MIRSRSGFHYQSFMFRRNLLSIACVCVVIVAADCGAARGASSSAGASEPTVLIRGTRVFDGRNVIERHSFIKVR